jgi:hypothetical protein
VAIYRHILAPAMALLTPAGNSSTAVACLLILVFLGDVFAAAERIAMTVVSILKAVGIMASWSRLARSRVDLGEGHG